MIEPDILRRAVRTALEEDIGPGDVTSIAVIPEGTSARGRFVAKSRLVVCGLFVAREVFRQINPEVRFRALCDEGSSHDPGSILATLEGSARSILMAERTALNFLQRMSGIATRTRSCVKIAASGVATIADTRKTVPGLRQFDREAVRTGGGENHRAGLYDAILIKDNHWRLAGGIHESVRRARAAFPDEGKNRRPIQIEVGGLAELDEALASGVDAVLLDNMNESVLKAAVSRAAGQVFLEVSGGVTEERIPSLAALAVQRISMGSLTHSSPAADIALEVEPS